MLADSSRKGETHSNKEDLERNTDRYTGNKVYQVRLVSLDNCPHSRVDLKVHTGLHHLKVNATVNMTNYGKNTLNFVVRIFGRTDIVWVEPGERSFKNTLYYDTDSGRENAFANILAQTNP